MEKFYAGVSFPTLIAYDSKKNFNLDLEKSSFYRRHYFFNTGGIITLNESLSLRPSTLIKYVPNAPLQADVNVSLLIKETLWIGASYRTNDAAVALIEYQVNKNFRLGYSFDFTTSALRHYSSGTHEIMLGIDLYKKDAVKTKTPRFF
jgi:type IX secretion system PorP/SprF family membrane protein